MGRMITFQEAAGYGFKFDLFGQTPRAWIEPERMRTIVQDAALITTPNTTVPAEFLSYISPNVVRILTAPREVVRLGREVKNGDWTTAYVKWRTQEDVGVTQPYSDYADVGTSDVNFDWNTREQYLFQTIIQYGDLEVALSSEARISLAAAKQEAAVHVIDIEANRFYFQGVAGREIYGISNDPNLPAAITAQPGASGNTQWATKTPEEIYNDILDLFGQLVDQSNGIIDVNTRLVLGMSPQSYVQLGRANMYNVMVMDHLSKFFSNLEIVRIPELANNAGFQLIMTAPDVAGVGSPTTEFAYGDKIIAGRTIPHLSHFAQKYVSTTFGAIIKVPFAIAVMTDI